MGLNAVSFERTTHRTLGNYQPFTLSAAVVGEVMAQQPYIQSLGYSLKYCGISISRALQQTGTFT